jgi:hypothetical protein
MTPQDKAQVIDLYFKQNKSLREIERLTGFTRWGIYRTLRDESGRPLRPPSKRKRYTEACERKIVDNYEKYGPKEAARLAGFSHVHVYTILRRHQHPIKVETRDQREQEIKEVLEDCYDLRELTVARNLPWEKVRQVAKKYDIPYHLPSSSGPRRLAQVKRMLEQELPRWLIASITNITERQVGNIRVYFHLLPVSTVTSKIKVVGGKEKRRTCRKRGQATTTVEQAIREALKAGTKVPNPTHN